uniref:Uncharacterized protein n=1 Tax=Plectus sambesii TaxID=2011161 RepID=A0A914WV31_9BILA
MERITRSSTAILCLQLLLLTLRVECQFRIPPITTSVFASTVEAPEPDSYGGQEVTVNSGQEFTIQIHLDQAPTEDDYDMFLSECSANGIPFMDNYGCTIRARNQISPVTMTRDIYVIRKDDVRLAQTTYKNDKFTFIYLRANGGGTGGGSVRIVCSVKYVVCKDTMTCQRQPGCTNYMSSNTIPSVQAVSVTASVRIERGPNDGTLNPTYPPPYTTTPNHPTGNPTLDKAGIAWWHIALICIVALLLFLAVIALLVALCCRKSADDSKMPSQPARSAPHRPDSRIYEEVYEQRHYYTPSENVSHATYAPTNVSESRVALAAYNNNNRHHRHP